MHMKENIHRHWFLPWTKYRTSLSIVTQSLCNWTQACPKALS